MYDLSNMSIWNVASLTEELKLTLYLHLINLNWNGNNHMQLVATVLERTHTERSLNISQESSHNAQFSQELFYEKTGLKHRYNYAWLCDCKISVHQKLKHYLY